MTPKPLHRELLETSWHLGACALVTVSGARWLARHPEVAHLATAAMTAGLVWHVAFAFYGRRPA
jgi:hypothetical protein